MARSVPVGGDQGRLVVVGAGTMGAQIAMQAALHGVDVSLVDVNQPQLQHAVASNRQWLERRVEKGKLESEQANEAAERVHAGSDLAAAASECSWAIEAVVEDGAVKRAGFGELAG